MAEVRLEQIHLIDDSDDEAFLARLLFDTQGLSISIAHHLDLVSFITALGQEETNGPLLVIVDLNMPGQRGNAVIAEMRGEKKLANAIIGICTGSEDPADNMAARDAGAHFFVKKPLDLGCLRLVAQTVPKLSVRENPPGKYEVWVDV